MRILIIDHDKATSTVLQDNLEQHGFTVDLARDGEAGLQVARARRPDLLIVNVLLPKKDGLAILSQLRGRRITTPLILVTERDSVRDCVTGFEIGADDYLVKPFAFPELLARVRSLLRRHNAYGLSTLWIGDLEINAEWKTAVRSGINLRLTRKQFLLLSFLAHSRGKVVSTSQIASHIWGNGFVPQSTLAGLVRQLRAKVDGPFQAKLICTVRGGGYMLTPNQPSCMISENVPAVRSHPVRGEENNLALNVANA
jgi:two-component system, OmpR family, copper resistance phosphate regulon response regulator CusR